MTKRCLRLAISTVICVFRLPVKPAGSGRAYITNFSSNTVSVIDTASETVVATVTVGTGPMDDDLGDQGIDRPAVHDHDVLQHRIISDELRDSV